MKFGKITILVQIKNSSRKGKKQPPKVLSKSVQHVNFTAL